MSSTHTPDHGSHAVQAGTATTRAARRETLAPQRPVRTAVVPTDAVEPLRPVDGWGYFNRVMTLALVTVMAFALAHVVLDPPTGGSMVMGETGRGWVVVAEALLFGLVGGALTAAIGYLIVLMMGGAARSAARYVIGGVVGGLVAALLVIVIFSNTAVLSFGLHLFWLLPLAGLLGGLWAGLTSAKR